MAFREIVKLDFYRILSRLRSTHAKSTRKTARKRPLIEHLHNAIHDRSIKATTAIQQSRRRARDLQGLFARLESLTDLNAEIIEAEEVLGEIVKEIHALSLAANLGAALQASVTDPTLKAYLPEAIGKLGRYYSATSELVCAARYRACRVFETIEVEPFQIPMPASLLKSHWKVHAEIQLLFFYEVYSDRPRPRFICSSKSACYMCNLFFSLHGGVHVPRTHGRLYHKWTLPDWLDIPAERRGEFSRIAALLKCIIDGKVLMASKSKRKMGYYYPNESVLLPLAAWSSSGISSKLSAQTSTSTVRPQYRSFREGDLIKMPSLSTALLPTPPRTPPQPDHAGLSVRTTKYTPAQENVSLITIGDKELPYSQSVSLATPSLHLELDTLYLTLDFLQVISGYLSTRGVAISDRD